MTSTRTARPHRRRRLRSVEPLEERTLLSGLFTEYPAGFNQLLGPITATPDGQLWFVMGFHLFDSSPGYGINFQLGSMTTDGMAKPVDVPGSSQSNLGDLFLGGTAVGPDGKYWLSVEKRDAFDLGEFYPTVETDTYGFEPVQGTKAGTLRVTGSQRNSYYDNHSNRIGSQSNVPYVAPNAFVTGPDGNFWFVDTRHNLVGRFDLATNTQKLFPIPTTNSEPNAITVGPDGALWFTEQRTDQIGRISADGQIREFALPTSGALLASITAGPDGALWFTEKATSKIGRITTDGQITEYALPKSNSAPTAIVAGPDNAIYVLEYGRNQIARVAVNGALSEYRPPGGDIEWLGGLTLGADGASGSPRP